jgi:uncharacterized protein YbaR (Trm112 family)
MKQIRCPECQARLSIPEERAAGAIICPKCNVKFKPPQTPLKEGPPPLAAVQTKRRSPVSDDDYDDVESAPKAGGKRRPLGDDDYDDIELADEPKKGVSPLVWVAVFGGIAVLLLMMAGLGFFFFASDQLVLAPNPPRVEVIVQNNPIPEPVVDPVAPAPDLPPAPRAELKPEPKPEVKPEPRAELKPDPKADARPETRVERNPEDKQVAKVEQKPEPKIEVKPEIKPEVKPSEVKPASKPVEVAQNSGTKTDAKKDAKKDPAKQAVDPEAIFIVGVNHGFAVPAVSLAAQEKKLKERIDYHRKTLAGFYEKIGKKDGKWDKEAKSAMEEAALIYGSHYETKANWANVQTLAKKALDAGCDDPLVIYLHAIAQTHDKKIDEDKVKAIIIKAALAIEKSKYPSFRRAQILQAAAEASLKVEDPDDPANKQADRLSNSALGAVLASAREDEKHPTLDRDWMQSLIAIEKFRISKLNDMEMGLVAVEKLLLKQQRLIGPALKARAQIITAAAYDARGSDPSAATPDGLSQFGEKIGKARTYLESAWKANVKQDDGQVAAMMLANLKAQTSGDNAEAKLWFDRAMKADPDNREACDNLLGYLDPKAHGSPEAIMSFGRSCRDSKNWRAGITVLIGDAHVRATDKFPEETKRRYLKNALAQDIKPAYDEYFKHRPGDVFEHLRFAVFCHYAGDTLAAAEHFDRAGDVLVPFSLVDEPTLRDIRDDVRRASDKMKSKEKKK